MSEANEQISVCEAERSEDEQTEIGMGNVENTDYSEIQGWFEWDISIACFPRFRALTVDADDPEVGIRTRTGGGNREHFVDDNNHLRELEGFATTWAAKNGHLDCLKYLHENGSPWDDTATAWFAENGHLDCLEYLQEINNA